MKVKESREYVLIVRLASVLLMDIMSQTTCGLHLLHYYQILLRVTLLQNKLSFFNYVLTVSHNLYNHLTIGHKVVPVCHNVEQFITWLLHA